MTDLGKAILHAIPYSPDTDLVLGTCVSISWAGKTARVNWNGQETDMPMLRGSAPVPQFECWVGEFAGKPVCLGPAAGPSLATVSGAPASGKLPITGDDGVAYQAAYDPNVTAWSTGQRVYVSWAGGDGGGPVVVLKLSDDPSVPDPTVPPPPVVGGGPVLHDLWFDAQWSGTQNGTSSGGGSFWTDRVYCGSTTLGAWGFGTSVGDTIPDTASINYVGIVVSQSDGSGGTAPTFGLHSLPSRSGVLSVSGAVTVSGGSGEKQLPNTFGDYLKLGQANGIGTHHGGYWIYDPAGVNGSGRLHIQATW